MLIEENFEVLITSRNIDFYRKLGFSVDLKDKINIMSSQLTPYNKNKVKVECDYCGNIITRMFKDHYKIENKNTFNGKHACKSCAHIKSKDVTNEFYNGTHPSQQEDAINKRKSTNMMKYGAETPLQSKEIQDKIKLVMLDKYGVDNIFKHESFYDIRANSMIKKYGYTYVINDPNRKDAIISKRNNTLYENKKAPCSTQQLYIQNILGGELNYPIEKLMLDIAFIDENIYIEYQGSGHNLDVKLGKITNDNFKIKEMKRYYFLKNKGWKMIEIISRKDYVPRKEKLLEMLVLAREVLSATSVIQFDIDNNQVKYNKKYFYYDFGNLISYSILHKSIERNTYEKLLV